ncbi:MAG: acylphosphatase [Magnetovibrio sp.]|nr:acylphosphatase [Magnetovibrio sp.]
MTEDRPEDNVIPFKRPGRKRSRRGRTRHSQGPKRQFQHHDRVVRLHARGLVHSDVFVRWLVELATNLHLDGWARSTENHDMDILIAGEEGDVRQMMEHLQEGPRPVDMLMVEEVVMKGNEPLWQGFHHLSPAGT